ncbi:MAG: TRAP transporter substrate-binding protein DctP [Xanthobacteraceae bacterium]
MRSLGMKGAITALALLSAASAACGEETRLLFTSMSPAGGPNSALFRQWADKVSAEGDGTLKIEVRDGLALANYGNVYDRVQDDVVQIGWAIHPLIGGKFPLSEIAGLPFVADNAQYAGAALWRLYKTGLLDAEYKDIVPIWFTMSGQAGIHYAKTPKSKDNLSGLKVGVLNPTHGKVVRNLEGTPIALPSTEYFEALQRGTIDAGIISWAAFQPFKLQEVTTYHLEGPLGANTMMFFMSRKKWDTLPAAARTSLEANGGEKQSLSFGNYMETQASDQRTPLLGSSKHTIEQLSADQRAKWEKEVVGPVNEEWAKSRANGDKVVEAFRKIYADVKAGRPGP